MSKFRHLFAAHVTAEMRDAANTLANARGWRGAVYSVPLHPLTDETITNYGLCTRATDPFIIEMYLASTGQPPSWANEDQVTSVMEGLSGSDSALISSVMSAVTWKDCLINELESKEIKVFNDLLTESGLKVYENGTG